MHRCNEGALSACHEGKMEAVPSALLRRPVIKELTHEAFREIERELSAPLFFGVPLGSVLNDCLMVQFITGHADWRWRRRLFNRALMARHWLYPRHARKGPMLPTRGRTLVTWLDATPRLNELVRPVVQALVGNTCVVLCGNKEVASCVPCMVAVILWEEVQMLKVAEWRSEYQRCRPLWAAKLTRLCRKLDLPEGAFDVLAFELMIASQGVAACIEFLKVSQPRSIVTDYDRSHKWACLVLAARVVGIPTTTLTHGIMHQDALGFSPVLADNIVCWGDLDRAKLLAAGERPEKVIAAGCPRLDRELGVSRVEARTRLALNLNSPVIIFASAPDAKQLASADLFCEAIEMLPGVAGVVRLHPSENLRVYSSTIGHHPKVIFLQNEKATLDECMAAADVIVVHSSGVGSDALVKGRPAVVLSCDGSQEEIFAELSAQAGCPRAKTPEELAQILSRIINDSAYRLKLSEAAEQYVARFCKAFGVESAHLIADIVKRQAEDSLSLANGNSLAIKR